MIIYREKPGRPTVKIYETNEPENVEKYKLGITASQRLTVYRFDANRNEFAWRSPVDD